MKWVNFQAWTDFRGQLSWILPANIRVDASSTLKTHQLSAGKQKKKLVADLRISSSWKHYLRKNQFHFICPFETKFLINRMNKSLQKKRHKTFENHNFVIHFSKSISTSPLSHNEQWSVFFFSFQKYISTRLPSNFWLVSFRSWLFLKETKSITATLRTNYLYMKP